jgi:hypothetical protein
VHGADGYADNADDCDDSDATLNPSTPWYTDEDGDGYGTVLATLRLHRVCRHGPRERGLLTTTTRTPTPGPTSSATRSTTTATDPPTRIRSHADTYYVDADGDDYGDPASPVVSCWSMDGYSDSNADCNDGDAAHPPRCDSRRVGMPSTRIARVGATTACTIFSYADVPDSYVGEEQRARAGESIASLGDVDGDGQDDLVFGAPYVTEEDLRVHRRGCRVHRRTPGDGVDAHAGESTRRADLRRWNAGPVRAPRGDGGDVNDDGVVDLVVGSGSDDINLCPYCGDIRIFLGPIEDGLVQGDADVQVLYDLDMYANFGDRATHGDYDSDGVDDIVVAGSQVSVTRGATATAWCSSTGVRSTRACWSCRTRTPSSRRLRSQGRLGLADARDADGDGVNDIAIGASGQDAGNGSVFLFHGPLSGTVDAKMADVEYTAEDPGDRLGSPVQWGGDLDGDGTIDLLVGAASPRRSDRRDADEEGCLRLLRAARHEQNAGDAALVRRQHSQREIRRRARCGGRRRRRRVPRRPRGGAVGRHVRQRRRRHLPVLRPVRGAARRGGADVIFYGDTKDQSGSDVGAPRLRRRRNRRHRERRTQQRRGSTDAMAAST